MSVGSPRRPQTGRRAPGSGRRARGRRRPLAALLVAVGLAAGAAVVPTLAGAGPVAAEGLRRPVVNPVTTARLRALDRWQDVIKTFETAGVPSDGVFVAADAASALAHEVTVSGWRSTAVPGLVDALAATANPDGGYGLATPWDAYQDGTVNAATTTYTATTAGHVGPILLAGYLAGVVRASLVDRAVDAILDMPRSFNGSCIPYSTSPNDLTKPCVWNVDFGAAAWVKHATEATGHRQDDAAALVTATTSVLTLLRQDPVTGYWPYSSAGGAPQDIGHQMWTAAAVDDLRGNHDALTLMISRPYWRQQARTFHDYNVASAMSGIALFDCRLATDPIVLSYAGSTSKGTPYVFKALATQAREVVRTCFVDESRLAARSGPLDTRLPALRNLG